MQDVPRENDSAIPELPAQLKRDLGSLYLAPVNVASRLDDAILNRAHAHLAGKTRRWSLRWAGAAIAAAACAVLVWRVSPRGPLAPDDLDGNRRVDIVDALHLAHQINAGGGRDINADGMIDEGDVDAIAMVAVQLDPGGVQ